MSLDMIPRTLFSSEHEDFRASLRRFLEDECVPQNERWEEQQFVDRAAWLRAGELGFLCVTMPEPSGGAGVDRRYSVVRSEESRVGKGGGRTCRTGWSPYP